MIRLFGLSRRFSASLVLGLGLATAVSAQPRPDDLSSRLDRVADRLDLTDAQSAQLGAMAANTPDPSQADLWTITSDLHALLTPEQKASLRERGERGSQRGAHRGGRRGQRGARGARRGGHQGERGSRGRRGEGETAAPDADRAARQAQREAMRPLREATREQQQQLRDQLRSGQISDAEFTDASKALRGQMHAQMRDAATPEQRTRMDARTAEREAAQAARDRVLGLTDTQRAQRNAQRAERARSHRSDLDVRPFLDADGRLDRGAMREAQREARPERGERQEVLTERQQELVRLHRALSGSRGHRRAHRRGRR